MAVPIEIRYLSSLPNSSIIWFALSSRSTNRRGRNSPSIQHSYTNRTHTVALLYATHLVRKEQINRMKYVPYLNRQNHR